MYCYRHVGPTDLKRHLLTLDNAGDRPPRYGNIETRGLSYRGAIETRRAYRHFPFFPYRGGLSPRR